MLSLRSCLLSATRSCAISYLPAAAALHRLLLSTAAPSSTSFVAEEFLITKCGLAPSKALKASRHLAHVKSPSKPEAVLAFFADVGLAKSDVAAAIARTPGILLNKVDKTLSPRFALLRDIGLSPSQISRLITIIPNIFSNPSKISRLAFYLSILGSYDKVHSALGRYVFLLSQSIERVIKPNMDLLRQCGLSDRDIAQILLMAPTMLAAVQQGRIKEAFVRADKLGVPRNSAMFKHALVVVYYTKPERINANLELLRKELGCSEDELGIMVRKLPNILSSTEDHLSRVVNYLKMEVGLETKYIVNRPALLRYSMTTRIIPRRYVLKVLQAKGLVKKDIDFYGVVCLTEKIFVERFIDRHKEDVRGLKAAYAEKVATKTKA